MEEIVEAASKKDRDNRDCVNGTDNNSPPMEQELDESILEED